MDAIEAVRALFVLATCTTLAVSLPAALRSRFVAYGARATSTSQADSPSQPPAPASKSFATRTMDSLASFKVPHGYFTHFYVVSVLSSLFWTTQVLLGGVFFRAIAERVAPAHLQPSMSFNQVILCCLLMLAQGSRRLYESFLFAKPSSSKMGFAHWLMGIAFYLGMGVAIWIEGTGNLLSKKLSFDDIKLSNVPSLRTFFCLPLFLMASGLQHDCHHYLFSLKKYTLPTHPLFRGIICPHYTAECIIYLSLALLAAPKGEFINKTLVTCLLFVAVNLGITAKSTKTWYMQKFGDESVRGRWIMIPGIY
ncbi:hypothetical protein ASPZODRAFT_15109 [Penicilliopsis zonata CBS 506.65]|uniref:Polyprenal reductase n=1 Tax=Penicilliopsis zonata CBS 506.65 TaxID=1073090 RepID=A0A1L9SK96_9EURO|nr:hypothetical protein ASPZODRAFT_15109 [Penicilliopsis zonata CBS 506.65]OJJ47659.1 hypothetical protein ASPZODRAFT_15109 [Penicilliopsis zonata CBS 506.65]